MNLEQLEIHRELELLRQAGRVTKRRVPPKKQKQKIKERTKKLNQVQKWRKNEET